MADHRGAGVVIYRECVMCRKTRTLSDVAVVNDDAYCHGVYDGSPTCYERAQWPLCDVCSDPVDPMVRWQTWLGQGIKPLRGHRRCTEAEAFQMDAEGYLWAGRE